MLSTISSNSYKITSTTRQLRNIRKSCLYDRIGLIKSNRRIFTVSQFHVVQKQDDPSQTTIQLGIANPISSISDTNKQIKQYSSFSSIAFPAVLRDLFLTGQLNPPNPLLTTIQDYDQFVNNLKCGKKTTPPLPCFSPIESRHLQPALSELLKDYELKSENLDNKLRNVLAENRALSFEDLFADLDNIDFPIQYYRHLIELMRSVGYRGDSIKKMAPSLFSQISNHKYSSYSSTVMTAFEKLQTQIDEEIDRTNLAGHHESTDLKLLNRRKDIINIFMAQNKLDGGEISSKDTFDSLKYRLDELESKFSRESPEYNGNPPPARESIPLMYEILSIKKKMAGLMGYKSFADCCMIDRMAHDIDTIKKLHDTISEKVNPLVSSIMSGEIQMTNANLDGHFELDIVLSGLFHLCQKLFGIRIQAQNSTEKVDKWDPDVKFFRVYDDDNDGEYLGAFYLDPYARPYKQGGEWMGSIVDKRGDSISPLVYLSCYMNPPVWDDSPVHMSFSDVKGLFHEFGHVIQYLLVNSKFGPVSGPNAIEKDASEFVAQFMEYWLYDETVLRSIFREGYPIQEILEKLMLQRKHESALKFSMQTFLGQLEIDLHSSFDPNGEESIIAVQRKLASKYIPHNMPSKGDMSHLFSIFQSNADGHHVSSYRYLWSEVMSADAFLAFQEEGKDRYGKVGRQFREKILEVGASSSAKDSFHQYRGRDAKVDALLLFHGLC